MGAVGWSGDAACRERCGRRVQGWSRHGLGGSGKGTTLTSGRATFADAGRGRTWVPEIREHRGGGIGKLE